MRNFKRLSIIVQYVIISNHSHWQPKFFHYLRQFLLEFAKYVVLCVFSQMVNLGIRSTTGTRKMLDVQEEVS